MKKIMKFIFPILLIFLSCSSSTNPSTSLSIITVQIGFPENTDKIDIDSQIKIKLFKDDFVVKTEYLLWYEDEYKLNMDTEPGEDYQIKVFAYKDENIKYRAESEVFNLTAGERKSVELRLEMPLNMEVTINSENIYKDLPFSVTIKALDDNDQILSVFNEEVTITDESGTIIPDKVDLINGIINVAVTVTDTISNNRIKVTYGISSVYSEYFNVTEVQIELPDNFDVVLNSQNIYKDIPFQITITAKDANGNIFTDFNGEISLTDETGTVTPGIFSLVNGMKYLSVTISEIYSNNRIAVQLGSIISYSSYFDVEEYTTPSGDLFTNTKIAFHATRDVHSHVFIMYPDGTDQRQITFDDYNNRHPSWYPDGNKIIYCKRTWMGVWELFKINLDGTDDTQLTFRPNSDECPACSPDGSKISFQSYLNIMEVWVANFDGTYLVNLTGSNYNCAEPCWSPDGSKIVYQCEIDNNWEIYIMNSDGTNKERITNNSSSELGPTISPDGSKIAFLSDRDGNEEIYIMNIDGSNQERLTFNNFYDGAPSWSPDGTMITFDSFRDGNYEIYIMNADGSNQVNITNTPARERCPNWSPFLN